MNKNEAFKLVQLYVDGWKENNLSKITKPLASNCEIIESHGPTYKGIDKVRKWVKVWTQSEGKVNRWDITSFRFIDDTATFEWTFNCTVNKKTYHIEGITIAHFRDDRIKYLREYRTTKPLFEWDEKEIAD